MEMSAKTFKITNSFNFFNTPNAILDNLYMPMPNAMDRTHFYRMYVIIFVYFFPAHNILFTSLFQHERGYVKICFDVEMCV